MIHDMYMEQAVDKVQAGLSIIVLWGIDVYFKKQHPPFYFFCHLSMVRVIENTQSSLPCYCFLLSLFFLNKRGTMIGFLFRTSLYSFSKTISINIFPFVCVCLLWVFCSFLF
jgi:hypothetical protein